MKLNHKILSMFAVAVLATAACQTLKVEESGREDDIQNRDLVLRASWGEESTTKTSIQEDGVSVWWSTNENLNVFKGAAYSGEFTSINTEAAASADFMGRLSLVDATAIDDEAPYWAIYPYNESNSCDGNSVTLTIPANQTASEGTFADKLFPAVAQSATLDMHFYNVCGGACFTVAGEGIRSVTFKSRAGEKLAGKVKVAMDANSRPSIQAELEGETQVTVYAPDGGTFVPGKKYYAVLIPKTLSNGVDIEYRTTYQMATCTLNRSVEILRSSFGLVLGKDSGLTFVDFPIDRLAFPDAVFAEYVFDNFDWNHDGFLSQDERNNVYDISVMTTDIASLQGIEYFPNLQSLYCQGNSTWVNGIQTGTGLLTKLDVSQNTHLQYLNCYYNQLTSLVLPQQSELRTLICHTNKLTSLDVSQQTALETLKCYNNRLTSLDVSRTTELQNLECNNNQLASLDVSHLTKLRYLNCQNNQIASLDVSQLKELESLYCNNNQVSSLDVSQSAELVSLICYDNQLTNLDVSHNTRLVYLDFSGNQVSSIDLSQNLLLLEVYCRNNQLTSLDVSALPALQYFYCSNNPLQSFDISANTALVGLGCGGLSLNSLNVSHLPKLESLECWDNSIGSLDIRNNPKLRHLYCSSCELTSLDVTENPLLLDLECQSNQLTSLDVSGCPVLNYLYAVNNPMTILYIYEGQVINYAYLPDGVNKVVKEMEMVDIDATLFPDDVFRAYVLENIDKNGDGKLTKPEMLAVSYISINTDNVTSLAGIELFKNITELSCTGSSNNGEYSGRLVSLDLSQNTSLRYLYCYYNGQLASLDLSRNKELVHADLSYNALSSLTLPASSTLQTLYCSNNQLTSLDVSGRSALQDLYCQNNQLTSLDVSGCSGLSNLQCSFNQIVSLDLRSNTALTYIYVRDNTEMTTLRLPEGLQNIYYNAIRNCSALQEVEIPSSVGYISDYAFYACGSLTKITVHATTPPAGGDRMFDNTNNCPIYVPATSVEAYRGADYWSGYAARISSRAGGSTEGIGFDEW